MLLYIIKVVVIVVKWYYCIVAKIDTNIIIHSNILCDMILI